MILRVLLLITLVIFFASISWAEFTSSSGVGMRLEYNDNIDLEHDAKDDVIATVTPYFSVGWDLPNLNFSLKVGLIAEKYLDHTEEDDIRPDLAQPTELDLLLNLYKDLFFLRITDTFSQTVVDEGGRGGEGNRKVNLTNTNRLHINPYLQFALAKRTQLQMGYTYENLWYKDKDGDDSESHIYSTSLTQELSPKVIMSLNGSYTLYRPKNSVDVYVLDGGGTYEYDQIRASIGLSFQATERLQLEGTFGHTWLDYNEIGREGDTDEWSASADYEITSSYMIGTAYTKSVVVSVDDGVTDTDRFSAYLEYSDRFTLNLTTFINSSSYVEIDRDTDSYGGVLSGELPFNDKVGLRGLISYANYDETRDDPSDDETRDDPSEYDRYSALLALYYEIRLGRISAGYTYTQNDDNRNNDDDYTNNIVFLDASLHF
jgi:hypothetical protein